MSTKYPPNGQAAYFNGTFAVQMNPQLAALIFTHILACGEKVNLTAVCQMGRKTFEDLAAACQKAPFGLEANPAVLEFGEELQAILDDLPPNPYTRRST